MKKITWIFLLAFSSMYATAQVLPDGMSINQSEQFYLGTDVDFRGIVDEQEDSYIGYAYNSGSSKVTVMKFDKALNQQETVDINLKKEYDELTLEKVCVVGENIEVFYSDYDEEDKVTYLSHVQVPLATFTAGEAEEFKKYDDLDANGRVGIYLVQSEDGKKVGLFTNYETGNDELQQLTHVEIETYNTTWEMVSERKDLDLTSEGENAFTGAVTLTNEGNYVFTLMTFDLSSESLEDLSDLFKQNIVVLNAGKDPLVKPVKLEGKTIKNFLYNLREDGHINMVCVTKDKEEDKLEYYYTVFDTLTLATVKEAYSDFGYPNGSLFSSTPRTNAFANRVASEYSYLRTNFNLKKLVSTEEGAYLVAQTSFNSYGYQKGKNHLGAMVARFDADGELLWETGVPKIQTTKKGQDYGSIGVFEYRGAIGFITNHLPSKDNNNDLEQKVYKGKKSTSTYAVLVDDGGDARTMELLNISSPFYQPKYSTVNSNDALIIYGNAKTNYGFLEIVLE